MKNEIAFLEKLDDQIELFINLKDEIAVILKYDDEIELFLKLKSEIAFVERRNYISKIVGWPYWTSRKVELWNCCYKIIWWPS